MSICIRVHDESYEWHTVDPAHPPIRGDLIIMPLVETKPVPPHFTRNGPYCWKIADGIETGFPHPAFWVRPA